MENKVKAKWEIALDKRNEADYQAFCLLKRVFKHIHWDDGEERFKAIVDEFVAFDGEGAEMVEQMKEIIKMREDANEEFLQAASNISMT